MILVTGTTGFVGGKIAALLDDAIASPSLRGADEEGIRRAVAAQDVTAIVHTAAVSDIGECERDPDGSYRANVLIPVWLAGVARERGIKLICFSSDQVYSASESDGPYLEDHAMEKPANLYAAQKLEMEKRVLDLDPTAVLLRAEWMYDYYLKKTNYFMQMKDAVGAVSQSRRQYRGLTYVREVAENIGAVLNLPGGIYNFGSETEQSMYEITQAFLSALGRDVRVDDAPARHNLWMNCEKAKRHGVVFSSVSEGLLRCAADHGLLNGFECFERKERGEI